jgi:hypothetical protein
MKSIEEINEEEREHYLQCPECKEWFDMRNLNEVFRHEHYLQRVPQLHYSYSVKVGKPVIYYKNLLPIIIN